ncbi:TauD/TfdA family dioxygenase [Thioalkalivibrio halophilus]|uniref:Taurine catabolism dioxygenase TauD n=1 Tax=Thioalkalivibrio halophilus TaxID=252474 RepID=A0A1V3A1A4_9GAMM|nr:TauD/TfdA family dioxygenase [Thioalkalivibrio halophilus]OOC11178.1 taurine catabolism dioxygenase TauD [Thioalkalivibrio halophilus]
MNAPVRASTCASPFDLQADESWRAWRARRLACGTPGPADLTVELNDPARPTAAELEALCERIRQHNLAFYRCPSGAAALDRERFAALCGALGFTRPDPHECADGDGISALQVCDDGRRAGYIPYSNRPLSWHCDGYYNPPDRRIRAMLLHCVSDAPSGGENLFLDPELLYIRLRDENPEWITALCHPRALTIPANVQDGRTLRPAATGPVFSVDPASGRLHMRYTARTRSIEWRDDPTTRAAAGRIREILEAEGPGVLRHRLAPGEGVVCNNVLHARTGFTYDSFAGSRQRLLLRARFARRVPGT